MTSRTRRGLAVLLSVLLLGLGPGVLGATQAVAQAPRTISVPVPTATSGLCRASTAVAPQVIIPARSGVEYRLDGRRVGAGPVTVAPGTHTVQARSHTFRLSRQTTFRLVLRGAGQCSGVPTGTPRGSSGPSPSGYGVGAIVGKVTGRTVVAAPAAFSDSGCVSGRATGSSYQIPFVYGLMYNVDGKDQAAGTHTARDGASVTVVALAAGGHTLSGITQWTHTFRGAPAGCAAHDPSTRQASNSTTHSAIAAAVVVTLGTILVLSGASALLIASRRRRRSVTGRP